MEGGERHIPFSEGHDMRISISRLSPLTLALLLPAAAVAQTPATVEVRGLFMAPGVTGQEAKPHGWSEELVYALPLETGAGTGVSTANNPQGRFSLPGDARDVPGFAAGRHALFSLAYDRIPAFAINPDFRLPADDEALLESPAHYSVMYDRHPDEWGKEPWVGGDDFYQTFVAVTPHITRIAVKLADKSGDHQTLTLNHAVYETAGGPPSKWQRISPVRSRFLGGGVDPIIHIFHVRYRSDEFKLTPGKTYAVRFWRGENSGSERFAIVARQDQGNGYRGGQLYQGDTPLPERDAYAHVSGGAAGTIVNHAPVGDIDLKTFAGGAARFGQTFKAGGTGLAGVDVIYADGNAKPASLPVTFQLYDAPGGKPIGPARVCRGLPLPYQARAAAVWLPGEAPLVAGRTYYLEWTTPKDCNTWVLNEDLPGEAYRAGEALPDKDLAMSIVEYDGAGR
jgi:hypothetical protein